MDSEDREEASASGESRDRDSLDARRERRVQEFLRLRGAGRALYSDKQGNPVLRKSFAVFVDELGTSQRMNSYRNKDLRNDLALYDETRLSLHSPDNRSHEFARPLYFTDNVMLAVPAWPDVEDHGLGYSLAIAAEYQARLAVAGRFSRGGIAFGELYADHSFGTGPALVEAVLLEKKAGSPRVLLDTRCLKVALAQSKALGVDPLRQLDAERLVLRDGDDAFVNYLETFADSDLWLTGDALKAHGRAIQENLELWAGEEHVRQKYEWLADYHDYFVTQILWYPEYVIGSPQAQRFAPLTSRRFNFNALVGERLARTFHQASAKEDVAAIVRAGRPAASRFHAAEYPDLEWFFCNCREAAMAAHSLCVLRDLLRESRIPQQHAADVSKLVRYSESVICAIPRKILDLRGFYRRDVPYQLIELADALRLARLSPQHWNVGWRKALELGALVGATEPPQPEADPDVP